MATQKTNAQVDTAAAAVGGDFGPLTRVDDLEALGLNLNSDIKLAFTTDDSTYPEFTVYLSYDELVDTDVRDARLTQASGYIGDLIALVASIDDLNTFAAAIAEADFGKEKYDALIAEIRADIRPYVAMLD